MCTVTITEQNIEAVMDILRRSNTTLSGTPYVGCMVVCKIYPRDSPEHRELQALADSCEEA